MGTLPDVAAVPGGIDDRDRVGFQLLLDLPRNNINKARSQWRTIACARSSSHLRNLQQKLRSGKLNPRGKAGTLASSALVEGDSAGPGAEAQAANPLVLRLLERGQGGLVARWKAEG